MEYIGLFIDKDNKHKVTWKTDEELKILVGEGRGSYPWRTMLIYFQISDTTGDNEQAQKLLIDGLHIAFFEKIRLKGPVIITGADWMPPWEEDMITSLMRISEGVAAYESLMNKLKTRILSRKVEYAPGTHAFELPPPPKKKKSHLCKKF